MDKKKNRDPTTSCIQEIHFRSKTQQVESERMKNIFNTNANQKRIGVAVLISDKIDFKSDKVDFKS